MSAPTTDRGGIEQTIRALRAAGYELDSVYDGMSYEPDDDTEINEYGDQIVHNEPQAVEAILAVDDAQLYVKRNGKRSWVRFVMGNAPDEVICDHTVDLEDTIGPLIDAWMDDL